MSGKIQALCATWALLVGAAFILSSPATAATNEQTQASIEKAPPGAVHVSSGVLDGDPYVEYIDPKLTGTSFDLTDFLYCYADENASKATLTRALSSLAAIALLGQSNLEEATVTYSRKINQGVCFGASADDRIPVVFTGRVFFIFRGTKQFVITEAKGLVDNTPSLLYFGRILETKDLAA